MAVTEKTGRVQYRSVRFPPEAMESLHRIQAFERRPLTTLIKLMVAQWEALILDRLTDVEREKYLKALVRGEGSGENFDCEPLSFRNLAARAPEKSSSMPPHEALWSAVGLIAPQYPQCGAYGDIRIEASANR